MRRMRQWIGAFLVCLVLAVLPMTTGAAEASAESAVYGALSGEVEGTFYNLEDAGEYFRSCVEARVDKATITLRGMNTTDVWAELYQYYMEHTGVGTQGDYLYCQTSFSTHHSMKTSELGGMDITYVFTMHNATTAEQEAAVDAKVKAVLDELDLYDATDYEKVCGVYRYICENVTYDYNNLNDASYTLKYTAYGALINGTAVCQGYALLCYRMLLELGVDCRLVSGNAPGGGHAWNIVRVGDYYYNLDSTWDAGSSYWFYFLKEEVGFSLDHIRDDRFDDDAFHTQYPMAALDYSGNDLSELQPPFVRYSTDQTTGKPLLRMRAVPEAQKYEIWCADASTDWSSKLLATTTSTTFLHEDAVAGNIYRYKVRSISATETSQFSVEGEVVCTVEAPVLSISATDEGYPKLTWTAVAGAQGYRLLRCDYVTVPDYSVFYTIAETTDCSYVDTGSTVNLDEYMGCHYIVQAILYGDIVSGYSNIASVTDEIAHLPAPTLTVTKDDYGVPCLNWTYVEGATGYEVHISTDGTNFSKTKVSGRNMKHTATVAGTKYYYKVRAYSDADEGEFSNVESIVAGSELAAPVLTLTKTSGGKPVLTWAAVDGATEYEVFYSTNGTSFLSLIITEDTKLTHSSAKAGTTYYYKVRAINATINGAFSAVKSMSVAASLTAPTLTVSKTSAGKPYLTWTGVTGATKYEVYYSTNGTSFTKLIATTGKVLTHTSAKAGTTYYYKVRAINATTNGAFSAVKSMSVAASLTAPTLTVSKNSNGKPYLTWTGVTGATKYEVYYSTNGTSFTKLIATTGRTLTHSSAKAGTTYYYKVRAINATINGAFSAVKSAVMSLSAPTLTVTKNSSGKPYLTWTAVSGATKYEVYYSTNGTSFTKLIATTGKVLTHSSAKAGTTYYYKVRAINATTNGAFSAVKSAAVSLAAPTLTVTKNSAGKPYLTWTGVTGATKYEVYYSTNGTSFTKLIATTGKVLTHSSAKSGTTYWYKVRAINGVTSGAFSAVKNISVN